MRATDWKGPNFKFEVVVSPEVADKILEAVKEKYLTHYAVIVWLSNVDVLRGDKFAKENI